MTITCPDQSTPEIQQPQGSPLKQRIQAHFDDIASLSGVVTKEQELEAALLERFALAVATQANIPNLTNYSKVENILATALGWKSAVWKATDLGMTEAGAVRYLLQDRAKQAVQILETVAGYKSLPEITQLWYKLQQALPDIDTKTLQEILHDQVVVGQYPKLLNVYDSPLVHQQLTMRYQAHVGKLQELGLSSNDISQLAQLAGRISANLDASRAVLGNFGLDIEQLQNGGYFPLQTQKELKRILEKTEETALKPGWSADLLASVNTARRTGIPIVLDLPQSAKVLGISEQELAEALVNPGEISNLLRSKFTQEELEKLYETGVLTQLPALSDELVAFYNDSLDLPIANLGEAIVLDPVKALQKYNQELKRTLESSTYIKTTLEEGVEAGWLLEQTEVRKLPNAKDYIRLGSSQQLADLIPNANLRETIANAYIHRTAAEQLKALLELNTDSVQLGLLGRGLQKFTDIFKKTVILGAGDGYLKRVFVQNAVALQASTGSRGLANFALGLADTTRVLSKRSTSVLSDEAFAEIGGKSWNLRELYEATFLKRGGSYASVELDTPISGNAVDNLFSMLSPESWARFQKFQEIYHQRFGSPATGKITDGLAYLGELADKSLQAGYEQLAKVNQFSDYTARWTAIRTLAENPRAAGRQKWESFDELIRYTDEYWGINEDAGSLGKTLGRYIPFVSFAMQAPGSAVRHAMRHPYRYGRMLMLYTQVQNASLGNTTDAELAQWQKDGFPIFVGKDTEGKTFSINPGTVDFYLDTSVWAKENLEKLGRTAGLGVGSTVEVVDSELDPTADLKKAIADLFQRSYYTKPLAAIFGKNPRTLENETYLDAPDTILGLPTDKWWRNVITEVFPVLRRLDQILPREVVGQSAKLDNFGRTLEPATPSIFGATPYSGGQRRPKESEGLAWVAQNLGGLSLAEVDPQRNLVATYKDLDKRKAEVDKQIKRLEENLSKENLESLVRLTQLKGVLEYNKFLVDKISLDRNLAPPLALEYIRKEIRKQEREKANLEFLLKLQQDQGK